MILLPQSSRARIADRYTMNIWYLNLREAGLWEGSSSGPEAASWSLEEKGVSHGIYGREVTIGKAQPELA